VTKTLRVGLAPTMRTDLQCVACGGFLVRAVGKRGRNFALVAPGYTDADASAGIHGGCVAAMRARREPRVEATPAADELPS
jgi:hypothetical protein